TPVMGVVDVGERIVLEEIARAMVYPYRDVVRARTILMLADGVSQAEVARRVGLRRRIVRKWAERFVDRGLRGLNDAPRSGRPPRFSPDRGDTPGQARLRAARGRGAVAVDLDLRRPGTNADPRTRRRRDLGIIGPADPGVGEAQAVANPSLPELEVASCA